MGLIVVGLGTLAVMELGTPARTKTSAPDPFEQLLVDVNTSRDTLKTTDRLEIHHLRHETPVQPISPIEPARPPDVAAILPQRDSSSVENHHRGAGEETEAKAQKRGRQQTEVQAHKLRQSYKHGSIKGGGRAETVSSKCVR